MGLLDGKKALIFGVASNRSIAWGIAQALHREGAELALTYQNEKLRERVEHLGSELDVDIFLPCDVHKDEEIEGVFEHLDDYWDHVDILVHSLAFAPQGQLEGSYIDNINREAFNTAHEVSCYSFAAMAKAGRGMFKEGSSLLTLSYLGAVRAIPHYNIMGLAKASLEANVRYLAASLGPDQIRVNAISAGPIKTLAAKGVNDFNRLLEHSEKHTPLKRNVTIGEVGNAATFLCSDMASGVTGEVLYVDGGYNITGMNISDDKF